MRTFLTLESLNERIVPDATQTQLVMQLIQTQQAANPTLTAAELTQIETTLNAAESAPPIWSPLQQRIREISDQIAILSGQRDLLRDAQNIATGRVKGLNAALDTATEALDKEKERLQQTGLTDEQIKATQSYIVLKNLANDIADKQREAVESLRGIEESIKQLDDQIKTLLNELTSLLFPKTSTDVTTVQY